MVNEISDPGYHEVLGLADSGDIKADIRDLARRLLKGEVQPRPLQLRRLVIGEASRCPEPGRTCCERGPGRTIAALATAFERLDARDVRRLDDPALAAAHLHWVIVSAPLNEARLLGSDQPPARTDLKRHTDSGVRVFLAACRNNGQPVGRCLHGSAAGAERDGATREAAGRINANLRRPGVDQ